MREREREVGRAPTRRVPWDRRRRGSWCSLPAPTRRLSPSRRRGEAACRAGQRPGTAPRRGSSGRAACARRPLGGEPWRAARRRGGGPRPEAAGPVEGTATGRLPPPGRKPAPSTQGPPALRRAACAAAGRPTPAAAALRRRCRAVRGRGRGAPKPRGGGPLRRAHHCTVRVTRAGTAVVSGGHGAGASGPLQGIRPRKGRLSASQEPRHGPVRGAIAHGSRTGRRSRWTRPAAIAAVPEFSGRQPVRRAYPGRARARGPSAAQTLAQRPAKWQCGAGCAGASGLPAACVPVRCAVRSSCDCPRLAPLSASRVHARRADASLNSDSEARAGSALAAARALARNDSSRDSRNLDPNWELDPTWIQVCDDLSAAGLPGMLGAE